MRYERLFCLFRDCAVRAFGLQLVHDHQRVVPKGLDFDGFAISRSDGYTVNSGIHPGELFAGVKQAVFGGVNVEASAFEVPFNDLFHQGQKMLQDERAIQ